jgi:O-antigen ligase
MSRLLDKAIIAGLLLALVFTALAHGAVEAWSVALFELMTAGLILLWAIKGILDRRLSVVIPRTALPIIALLVYALAQSIAIADGAGRAQSLSMDIEATRRSASVLFFLLVSFIISANFFISPKRLRALAYFMVIYGVVMAMFALVQHFTWNGKFYWIIPNTRSASPFGPFVSHNHFSGYMEMLFPIPAALMMTRAQSREARLFFGFAAAIMIVAAVASLSRGGMISIFATLVFLLFRGWKIRAATRRSRAENTRARTSRLAASLKTGAAALALVAVIALGFAWVGPDRIIERITTGSLTGESETGETFYTSRGWIWKDTLSMISANPVLGVGFGAYETVFATYSDSNGMLVVGQAHNDYLQILADCGAVGGMLALWFIWEIFRAISRGIRSRDRLLAWLALGAGAGVFAILVHSFLDFNLQLISNVLLFMMLLAVVSQIERLTTVERETDTRLAKTAGQAGVVAQRA